MLAPHPKWVPGIHFFARFDLKAKQNGSNLVPGTMFWVLGTMFWTGDVPLKRVSWPLFGARHQKTAPNLGG